MFVTIPYTPGENRAPYQGGRVFLGETKQIPSFVELFKTAQEFIPMSKISLNIEAEEYQPSVNPESLLKAKAAVSLPKVSEPTDSNPAVSKASDKEPEEIVEELKEQKVEERQISEISETSIDSIRIMANNDGSEQINLPGLNGKHTYSIEDIINCFKDISAHESFAKLDKRLSDFSHRKYQVYKLAGRNSQKKQKSKKEFLRQEEFKPTDLDFWRRAKTQEEEKIHQQALQNTLKLTTTKDDNEKLKRKIKVTLNKLSPSNFDKLQSELVGFAKASREALYFLVETLFEKAWAEAKYTSMYAQLCKVLKKQFEGHLFDGESPSKKSQNWFKYALLSCIQSEFDSNIETSPAVPHAHIQKKTHGNVRFIGELIKVQIITAKIIQDIVETLISLKKRSPNSVDEQKIEVACVLVSTVGHFFENKKLLAETNKIFTYLTEILEVNKTITSKLRFRIMNLIDERASGWRKDVSEQPKTVEEIRSQFESEQAEIQQRHRY